MNRPGTKGVLFVAALVIFAAIGPFVGGESQRPTAVKLNAAALEYAKDLIQQGYFIADGKGAWSEHQPSAEQENEFIRRHGFGEYAKWHLGIDDRYAENTKRRYKFPYGDFKNVHRCALLAAQSRAGQYEYYDIENAAAQLRGMIEMARQACAKTLSYSDVQALKKVSISSGSSSL